MPFSFSRFIYLDTNVLSIVARTYKLWRPLFRYLADNDLTIALSEAQIIELIAVTRTHDRLLRVLLGTPSALVIGSDKIMAAEVEVHPGDVPSAQILSRAIPSFGLEPMGIDRLRSLLSGPVAEEAYRRFQDSARQMSKVLNERKANFPPSATGKYTLDQANMFADGITLQWLAKEHYNFVMPFRGNVAALNLETFKSIRLFAYVIFYKYYLGQRKQKRLSDFGDLGHLQYIPYCEVAVMERDLTNILGQIQRHQKVIQSVELKNIDFIRSLK